MSFDDIRCYECSIFIHDRRYENGAHWSGGKGWFGVLSSVCGGGGNGMHPNFGTRFQSHVLFGVQFSPRSAGSPKPTLLGGRGAPQIESSKHTRIAKWIGVYTHNRVHIPPATLESGRRVHTFFLLPTAYYAWWWCMRVHAGSCCWKNRNTNTHTPKIVFAQGKPDALKAWPKACEYSRPEESVCSHVCPRAKHPIESAKTHAFVVP